MLSTAPSGPLRHRSPPPGTGVLFTCPDKLGPVDVRRTGNYWAKLFVSLNGECAQNLKGRLKWWSKFWRPVRTRWKHSGGSELRQRQSTKTWRFVASELDRRGIFVSASGFVKKRWNRDSLHHSIRIHRTQARAATKRAEWARQRVSLAGEDVENDISGVDSVTERFRKGEWSAVQVSRVLERLPA